MNPSAIVPPLTGYQDRSTGLMVLGIFTILFGGLCGLMAATLTLAPASIGPGSRWQNILPALLMYGGLAVAMVWLGIGSILARRWARALLLIFSWSMLVMGLVAVVFTIVWFPQMLAVIQTVEPAGQAPLPPAVTRVLILIPLILITLFMVLVPAVGVLFYRSPHVRATCEARDPVPRWTDACPLPVLAVALWLAATVLMMLMIPFAYRGLFPLFGSLATGVVGSVAALILAAIWGWCAWAFYQLDVRGWWLLVVSVVVFTLSAILTYSRHDLIEVYALMGYPEEHLALLRQVNFTSAAAICWSTGGWALAVLGYLLFIRRYFRSPEPAGVVIAS